MVRRTVTSVVFIIAGLSFAFGFGNGWALGVRLGVPGWIAPLVAPAVDLSVVALLATVQFLRSHGLGGRLVGPRLLLVVCGLITFALNTARPILAGQPGRACFDAVAPLLLIGWGEVGPRLLALMHSTVPDRPATVLPAHETKTSTTDEIAEPDSERVSLSSDAAPVPDDTGTVPDRPELSPELLGRARDVDDKHRAAYGRRITRDALRAQLKVSNAVAGALLRELRAAAAEDPP
jgi:hypothetical protein